MNSVTNTITGAVSNPLALPSELRRGVAGTVNRMARRSATPARRSGIPPVGERRYVPDQVVVSLPANLTAQARDALLARHNLVVIESQTIALTGTTFYRLRIGDGRAVPDVIRSLEADGAVGTAQPNYRYTPAQQTDVVDFHRLAITKLGYAAEKLHLRQAHRLATGDRVRIAVIDTAIDASHREISGNILDSFDALGTPDKPHPHGTAIAGAIVAHAKLNGAAPSATILAIHAFGSSGKGTDGTTSVLLRSIDWAVAHRARVINMSFTGPYDPEFARTLAAAHKAGVVLIAAAGNAGPKSAPLFPASDRNVIAVTATDDADKLLAVANRGKYIAVAAPGVDVLAAAPDGNYQVISGTSIAAAQVSGIAGLLLERKPDLGPDGVRNIVMATATDLGPKGRDDQFGAGLADAYRAVLSVAATAKTSSSTTAAASR